MRIVPVIQGSEEWDELRRGVPTASNFGKVITAARAQLSTSWPAYAAELIAAEVGASVPPPPSFWMQHGTEQEPYAVKAYEQITGNTTTIAGFVWPDDHERYGCSPDRLVGDDGLLEVKCPAPETLIGYHAEGIFPPAYKPQVMGQLWITERDWCDFFAYHPLLKPFLIRVERDDDYIVKLAVALEEFCDNLQAMRERLADIGNAVDVALEEYEQTTYETEEMSL